ncbi:coiled-coil domain-containing protein 69 [Lampris incognitus]|uniref:coiled-coil domain-containing protein 69 n=1 Tax=Lampris incognitus TaxID=2546036 RepID=UPI0024B56F41|nr:coiled-coil domain-containing protein 69 [Lampris incognitus]
MGCAHSKEKKDKKAGRTQKDLSKLGDGRIGKPPTEDPGVCLQKQLERFEWQLRILRDVLSANGGQRRVELLKEHAHEELCALVRSITDEVRTETAAELNAIHQQTSELAAEEEKRRLQELQSVHEQEKTFLTEEFKAAHDVLKGKFDELNAELHDYNELKRRVEESTFKKDLQRNIQTHGSPGAFWESEQESLLFVIEMKTERVQEQARKLQQMQTLGEKNLVLEDQMVQMLQQNEDLSVRIDSYQSVIQELSKELHELKGALGRQTAMTQRLSQEKEQLVFKLRHRDSHPTIQLSNMVPEMTPH